MPRTNPLVTHPKRPGTWLRAWTLDRLFPEYTPNDTKETV